MNPDRNIDALVSDELDVLAELVPVAGRDTIELGCGAATLARALLLRHPDSKLTGLEVDECQHAKNLASPQTGLDFAAGGAQYIPLPAGRFDAALMLKSLHHVPMALLAQALAEVVRLFNDEGTARAAARAALDVALATGVGEPVSERFFRMPVRFRDFADVEQRMMRPSFADHRIDDAKLAEVRAAFEPHLTTQGAQFARLMHVRVLRASAAPSC